VALLFLVLNTSEIFVVYTIFVAFVLKKARP